MTDRTFETIGFIGLGVMGEPMCRNLAAKGTWQVQAFDINEEKLARLGHDGCKVARSASDLARSSDVIITCLPGGDEVRELLLGEGDLMRHLSSQKILIDMSTSDPSLIRDIAATGRAIGLEVADAPIARTRQAAADGTLAIFVGVRTALV